MKTKLFFAGCLLIATIASGQNETVISSKNTGEITVTPPSFNETKISMEADNNSLLNQYLTKNIQYPAQAKNCSYQGTEVVQFTVTADGKVTDFKVINSVCPIIDDEVVSVLKSTSGMWKPGSNNGTPVAMTKEVSFAFCIRELTDKSQSEIFKERAVNAFKKGTVAIYEEGNPKKALKFYNQGINYLPYDKSLLLMRGLCKYELGNQKGAMEDWNRMASLGETIDMNEFSGLIENMKGYNEAMAVINK